MRTSFLNRSAFTLSIVFAAILCQAQDILIDASRLARDTTRATDLRKSFNVIFQHNRLNASLPVSLTANDGEVILLRRGVSANDTAQFIIPFNASDDKLTATAFNGRTITVSNGVFLTYGTIKIEIRHQESSVPPPNGNNNQGAREFPENTITGIEVHDAVLSRRYFDTGDDSLLILLGKWKNPAVAPDLATLKDAYKNNPFIKSLLDQYSSVTALGIAAQGGSTEGVSGIFKKIGQMDVTNIADGLARFLVQRTKEELSVAFFQRFRELINKPEYLDAQILFPKTLQTLNAIDQEIYQFENYITSLRESFEKDLSLMLDNLPTVIEEGRFKDYFTANPNLKYSLLLTLFTGNELENGTMPGKIIEGFPDEYINGLTDINASGSIRTVQLLSASFRSRGVTDYWTTMDTVQLLYKNDPNFVAAKFYLGFLYEKSGGIKFASSTLQQYLAAVAASENDIRAYTTYIKQFGQRCHDVESAIKQVKEKQPETPTIDVYNRLFTSFADVLEQINAIGSLPHIKVNGAITAKVTDYLKIFRQCNDLALNVVKRNYGSAVVNVYNIYLVALEMKQTPNSSITGNANLATTTSDKNAGEDAQRTSEIIMKFGNFMSNVVKANNSQEVAEAIEAVVLPVGSATIKRHSNWNIALNAYVGLFTGYERIRGVDDKFSFNSYGVTAPIGIAVSKGINWEKNDGWAFTFFFSIIDLGAPVAFRFEDDKTEKVPSIQLGDIISPGVFASFGLPKVPVSINVGWQSGPLLRKVNPQFATTADATYSRVSLSVVVDIPLLNFHSWRNKKIK